MLLPSIKIIFNLLLHVGSTQIWDCNEMRRLRTMEGHTARVCSHSWNQFILSSGSRSGQIIHHDVRQRNHTIAVLNGHSEEVKQVIIL